MRMITLPASLGASCTPCSSLSVFTCLLYGIKQLMTRDIISPSLQHSVFSYKTSSHITMAQSSPTRQHHISPWRSELTIQLFKGTPNSAFQIESPLPLDCLWIFYDRLWIFFHRLRILQCCCGVSTGPYSVCAMFVKCQCSVILVL